MVRSVLLFVSAQLLLIGSVAFGQEPQRYDLPKLQPSNISVFDIDAGLPISCTTDGLVDDLGRLWINPCFVQEEHQTVNFYQFDGKQSSFVEWENFPKDLKGQAALSGITKSGELFGFFRNTGTCFFFDINTRKSRFYSLDTAGVTVSYMGISEAHGIFMYGFSSEQHRVYGFEQGAPQMILSLPRIYADRRPPSESVGCSPVLTETDLWFSNPGKKNKARREDFVTHFGSIVQFNLITHAVRQYSLEELFQQKPPLPEIPEMAQEIAAGTGGTVWIYLKGWDRFIKLDPEKGSIHPQYPFSERGSYSPAGSTRLKLSLTKIEKDQVGNLLFYRREGAYYRAVLLDQAGDYYYYTPVLLAALKASRSEKGTVNDIKGRDFRRRVYLFMTGGLANVQLKLSSRIKISLEGIPTRAITELAPGRYMVLPEGDWPILKFNPEKDSAPQSAAPLFFDCLGHRKPALKHLVNIVKDGKGDFWIPFDKQIIRFNGNGACTPFPVGVDFLKFAFLNSETIFLESEGQCYLYRLSERKLNPYLVNGFPLKINATINQILVAKNNIVWIAGLGGLHRLDPATGDYRVLGRAQGFQDSRMMCIDEAADGRLWIGTYGGGLHIFDPPTGAITIIDQKHGLSNNIVVGILVDDASVRWLSTYKGITLVSDQGKVLTRIYKEDGPSTNEFNRYSYCKGSNGHLLFGSVNGINDIDPEAVKAQLLNATPLRIYLTGLTYFDISLDSLITKRYWPADKPLQLAATHRYLNLQFALSSLIRVGENCFAYKIEGPDIESPKEWTYLGTNNELNLQDLPAGDYNILIRGSDFRGNWTSESLVIPVHAAAFFYKQTWFIALCLFALFSLAAGWVYRQKIEQMRLEKELQKRTEEIMRTRDQLVVQEKLASLGQLTAGIAHEIKNPLNFVNNFALDSSNLADRLMVELEKIKENIDNADYEYMLRYLGDMKQNVLDIWSSGSTADRIVRSMMDHARGTSEKMQFLDMNHLLTENTHLAISGFKASRPGFLVTTIESFDEQAPNLYGSPLNLSRAFLNILNNACYALNEKQQAQGHGFHPELRLQTQVKDNHLEVRIFDNGPGIPPEVIKNIFTPFFTTKSTGAGNTGLGLSICYDIIVKEHGGHLEVDSEPGAYTEFTILLPISDGAPD